MTLEEAVGVVWHEFPEHVVQLNHVATVHGADQSERCGVDVTGKAILFECDIWERAIGALRLLLNEPVAEATP